MRVRIAAAAAAALAVALAGLVAAPAITAQAGTASPAHPASPVHPANAVRNARTAAPSGRAQKAQPKSVLLLNGDRMIIDGASTHFKLAGSGFAAAVTELRLAGREYAVPDAALPFLGHGLDLSLFDTAARPGGSRLSVRITYSAAVPRLPGVTIARAAGGVATGYLTAAGAVTFGAALARQFAADHGAASYGTDGLFGGGVWISAADGAGAASAAKAPGQTPTSPRFPMHTVTVRGLTVAGHPDTGDLVFLYNATNNEIYGDPYEEPSVFYHGSAKFSVPAGQYWALAWITTVNKKGYPTDLRTVLLPRIVIKGNATITMRGRSATSELTFTAPKPTTVLGSSVQLVITDKHGDFDGFGLIGGPGFPEWFSPTTQRLAAGTLAEFVSGWLTAPASGPSAPDTAPDMYSGIFQNTSGLIGSQHFALPAASLATVHAVYASDVPTTGGVSLSAFAGGGAGLGYRHHWSHRPGRGARPGHRAPAHRPRRLLAGPVLPIGQRARRRAVGRPALARRPLGDHPGLEPLPAEHPARLERRGVGGRRVSVAIRDPGRPDTRAERQPVHRQHRRAHRHRVRAGDLQQHRHDLRQLPDRRQRGEDRVGEDLVPEFLQRLLRRRDAAGRAVDGVVHARGEADRAAVPALDAGHRHVDVALVRPPRWCRCRPTGTARTAPRTARCSRC